MSEFRAVAKAGDIPPGAMKLVDLDGEEVVVANVGGAFYAFHNRCTHARGQLSKGELEGEAVRCPLHGGLFDLRTGEALEAPPEEALATYAVEVAGGEVRVARR